MEATEMPTMTYEQWCQNSKALVAECDRYNAWRRRTLDKLLSDLGPRIEKLGNSGYPGCGFHYAMVQSFGTLVHNLAMPMQWCANWCHKIQEQRCSIIHYEVSAEMLFQSVAKAERGDR